MGARHGDAAKAEGGPTGPVLPEMTAEHRLAEIIQAFCADGAESGTTLALLPACMLPPVGLWVPRKPCRTI